MTSQRISRLTTAEPYLIGLLLVICMICFIRFGLTQKLDFILYDFYIQNDPLPVPEDVAIIAIDEHSLSTLGQWPWRRSTHAELIRQIAPHNPKAIAFDVIFAEPDRLNPQFFWGCCRTFAV